MNFIDFVQFVKTQCMYETIYEDSNDNLILVTRMLDAYAMANKMVEAEREEMQHRIDTLHNMYELVRLQRDELMDLQRAQIEAMRGRVQ
jgi:hypothetical protein